MALFLRTCSASFTSYNNFQWPNEVGAIVQAPDWSPNPEHGHGLHGLLNGGEDSSLLSSDDESVQLWGILVRMDWKRAFPTSWGTITSS